MNWFRRIMLWLPGPRRSRALDLQEELRANLSSALDDAAESGLPREEAARIARRDFGSLTRAQEESRAVWLPGWDAFAQDLRFAWRALYRAPAFTLVASLSLALGIGAATALFSLVNTVVLKPLAYRDPGRLVYVREVFPPLAHIYPTLPVNFEHFRFWRDHTRAFESISALASGSSLLAGGDPELVGTALVTANFFETLGVQPQLGRTFLPDEDRPSRNLVAVIADSLWRRRFGASPEIAGQTIRVDGAPFTVAGVLPPTFRFPKNGELGPLTRLAERTEIFLPIQSANNGWGGDYDYMVFGRLRRDASLAQGVGELNLFEKRIAAEHKLSEGLHVEGRPLQEVIGSPVRTSLTVLLSAVLLLVLIVCVNLANLLLARSSARAREYSLRVALGAARGRLIVSALVETLLLSCAGGALGIAAAWAALGAFVQLAPLDLPRMDEARIDGRVLAFAFGLSLFCALLFGLLPALRLSRADPQDALRESRAMTPGRSGLRLREWLVGAEVALSALLLVLAGLLVSSLWHVLHVDRGFAVDRALDVSPALPAQYRTIQDKAGFFDLAASRLRALPGVRAVAVANKLPLTGESSVNGVEVEGSGSEALDPASRQLMLVNDRFISQDYFAALGIPVLRGRPIEAADRDRNVAVVAARLAAKLWPGQDPLGKVVSSGSSIKHAEIVGVVADVHSTQLERDPTLMIYAPFWQHAYQATQFVVRSAADPASLREEVRKTLQSIDPAIPPPKMRTMEEIVDESVALRRFQMRVAAAFGISALLLAALGIYGVVAYGIALRRRELGIRMALGARTQQVWRMVVWQGLRPVTAGLAVGMLAALAAGRLVRSLLFGVGATDGLTLGAVAFGPRLRSHVGLPLAGALRCQNRPIPRPARRVDRAYHAVTSVYDEIVTTSLGVLLACALEISAWAQGSGVPIPRFEDYPVLQIYSGVPMLPKIVTPSQRRYRTRIREGVEQGWGVLHDGREQHRPGPNFAGKMIVVQWGCGAPCLMMAMVDAVTGEIYSLPLSIDDTLQLPNLYIRNSAGRGPEVEFRQDSRLMVIKATPDYFKRNHHSYSDYYLWRDNRWSLLPQRAVGLIR